MKKEIVKRRFVRFSPDYEPSYLIDGIDTVQQSQFDEAVFYRQLRTSRPLLVKNATGNWTAMHKWANTTYLVEETKKTQATNYAWDLHKEMNEDELKKIQSRLTVDPKAIEDKIESIRKNGDGLDFSDGMARLQNLLINRNK